MAYKLKQQKKSKKEEEQFIIWNVNLADEPMDKPKKPKKKKRSSSEIVWENVPYDLKRHD